MLYIIDIDDVKFGVSGISDKLKDVEVFYPKTYVSNFVKGLDGKTQTDLITILSTVGHRKLVSIRKVAEISLAGVTYSKGMDFAIAFNRMTKGGKGKPDVTTTEEITTTTGITTTELTTTTEVTTVEITTTEIPVTTTEELTTTVPATTTEEVTTTVEATTTEQVTTTVEITTTEPIVTTEEVTTTAEITTTEPVVTTEEITTTEKVTTTEEITTTEKVTTTEEVTTTEPPITTTEQITTTELPVTTTEKITTTEEITTTDEAYPVGYYFSSNGNDADDGLSPLTAKKSLSAIGGLNFTSIRNVFLEKGSEWDENIEINSSGTSGNPITIDSYGQGAKPKIYGSNVITGWTQHSGNIYKATVSDFVSQVFVDGERMKSARYPKEGYIGASDITSNTEFSSAGLESESANYYQGALLGIRNVMYFITFRTVTASSGSVLTVNSSIDSLTNGKPFFLVNKLAFLTEPNEWYYDNSSNELYVWMPNNDDPANYEIRATVRDRGIALANGINFVDIKNINISQFNQAGIYSYNSDDLNVTNNEISQIQGHGIDTALAGYDLNYSHNKIKDIFTSAIHINYGDGYDINHNEIEDIGMIESIGNVAALHSNVGTGILSLAGDVNMYYNKIINTGYCGIYWNTGLAHIYRNYIDGACTVLNDGAAVYTFSQLSSIGSIIEENVLLNTWGTWALIENYHMAFGVYLDGGTEGITIKNNMIGMCGGGFNHNGGGDNTITGNIFFGCIVGYNSPSQSKVSVVEYNRFYQTGETKNFPLLPNTNFRFVVQAGSQLDEFNHNEYIAPYTKTGIFRGASGNYADFTDWQTTGQDANSSYDGTNKTAGHNESLIYNWSDVVKNFYLNNASSLKDAFENTVINNTFTLDPYEGIVLTGINADTVLDYEDSTPPAIVEFEMPETYGEFTVPITSLITSEDVTKYIITRNSTVPALSDEKWIEEKPISFTFKTTGSKELYLWARDAAGNVSNYALAEVEIEADFPAVESLVHGWTFNESVGSVVADGIGDNDGTATGTTIVSGLIGNARELDGSDDSILFGLPNLIDLNLTKDFSVSMWVNLQNRTGYGIILDLTYNWRTSVMLHQNYNGSQIIYTVNKYNDRIGTLTSPVIATDSWIHVVITWDASEEELGLYINGSEENNVSVDATSQSIKAGVMMIGSRADEQGYSNFIVDQTLIYDKVLTAQEASGLFNNGNGVDL